MARNRQIAQIKNLLLARNRQIAQMKNLLLARNRQITEQNRQITEQIDNTILVLTEDRGKMILSMRRKSVENACEKTHVGGALEATLPTRKNRDR